MPKNSAAGGIYGGFMASKIRRAVIFSADFRRTNFRRRIRRSAAAEGSKCAPMSVTGEKFAQDLCKKSQNNLTTVGCEVQLA